MQLLSNTGKVISENKRLMERLLKGSLRSLYFIITKAIRTDSLVHMIKSLSTSPHKPTLMVMCWVFCILKIKLYILII